MSHDNGVAQLSALVFNAHAGMADLALVNHASGPATVTHTTAGACESSYNITPEKYVQIHVRNGDMLVVCVGEQASGLYSVNCNLAPLPLVEEEEPHCLKLLQAPGILPPRQYDFDEAALDALFGKDEVLV